MAVTKHEWYTEGLTGGWSVEGVYQQGQSFTIGNTGVNENFNITSIKLLSWKVDAPQTLFAAIKAVDGDGKPTGAELSTGSIDPSGWGEGQGNAAYHEINMSAYTLLASTQYVLILRSPDSGVAGAPWWGVDNTSPTYGGGVSLYSLDSGSSWNIEASEDYLFEIWGGEAAALARAKIDCGLASTSPLIRGLVA